MLTNYLIKDHADHPLDRKNARRGRRDVAVVHVLAASVRNPGPDVRVRNPNPDRPNPNIRTSPKTRIGKDAAKINLITARGVTAIGKGLKRRAAEATKSPAKRNDPVTNQNPSSRRIRTDPQRITTRRRQQKRTKPSLVHCRYSLLGIEEVDETPSATNAIPFADDYFINFEKSPLSSSLCIDIQ